MTFSSSFAELMHYFGLHFTIYYAAALVPLAAVLRLLLHRRAPDRWDIALDIGRNMLLLLSVVCGGLFQGVVADLSVQNEHIVWLHRLLAIAALNIVLSAVYGCVAWRRRSARASDG